VVRDGDRAAAILCVVKPGSRVRWWEWLLIMLAATFPAMLLSEDEPAFSGQTYVAYGAAAVVAALIIAGLDRRRRAREEPERRQPTR